MSGERSEHPILFKDWSVRAILDGRKTQTRRPVKRIAGLAEWVSETEGITLNAQEMLTRYADVHLELKDRSHWNVLEWALGYCPYGIPGDRLWVREAWATLEEYDNLKPSAIPIYDEPPATWYRADQGSANQSPNRGKWRPSIFMPKWACRLWLENVTVRVEQVQEISEQDAYAEGIDLSPRMPHPIAWYRDVWNTMYEGTDYAWGKNPWVWAVEFRRVECTTD